MSAPAPAPAEAGDAKPKKSKKLLFIIVGVLVLALVGAGAALFLLKKNAADEEEYDDEPVAEQKVDPKKPPTYLPLDSMVVNLADPGGNRFAQMGITLKLQDEETATAIKTRMPSIRNSLLILISQRTADELLSVKGKQDLVADIVYEISMEMGYEIDDGQNKEADDNRKRRRRAPPNPVQDVLFSGFLVQ